MLVAEFCVKAIGELPAEIVSLEQIHDLYQVEEFSLQRDVGDLGRPDFVRCP